MVATTRTEDGIERTFWSIAMVALTAAIAAAGCSGGQIEIQSKWTDSSVVVDGNAEDWSDFPLEYSEEAKVSFGVRNDAENLYLIFRFRDEPPARFLQKKVTLWFDKTGKKKKDFGISYASGMPFSQRPRERDGFFENLTSEQKEEFLKRQSEMQSMITVLEKDTSVLIAARSWEGVAVAKAYEQGFFCHEMVIPLRKSDSTPYAIDTAGGSTIGLGVELGLDLEDQKKMMQERGGMPGGGGPPGRGRDGGGMPGGGRPGSDMRGGGRKMPEKQEIWLSVALASKPNQ